MSTSILTPPVLSTEVIQPAPFKVVIATPAPLTAKLGGGGQGVAGAPGADGVSFTTYEHDQMIASDVWVAHHNLGRHPSVTILDTTNRVVEGDIEYLDINTVRLTFSAAFSGRAFFN